MNDINDIIRDIHIRAFQIYTGLYSRRKEWIGVNKMLKKASHNAAVTCNLMYKRPVHFSAWGSNYVITGKFSSKALEIRKPWKRTKLSTFLRNLHEKRLKRNRT